MNVLVERYQRRKYVNQEDSQVLYYVRQMRSRRILRSQREM